MSMEFPFRYLRQKFFLIWNIYFNSYFYFFLFLIIYIICNYFFNHSLLCDSIIESVNNTTCSCSCSCSTSDYFTNSIEENVNRSHETLESNNESLNPKCINIFYNYQDTYRRKLYWFACVKSKGNFTTYKEFKEVWNPKTKVIKEIKKAFKEEMHIELNKVYLAKRTFTWIVNPRSRRNRS